MSISSLFLYLWAIGVLIFIFWKVLSNPIRKIQSATLNGDLETVRSCLEKGVDPDIRSGQYIAPICIATNRGYKKIVELLIEYGADINQGLNEEDGVNPLLAAAIEKYSELEAMYLELDAKIGIHYAALRGDLEQVTSFIQQEQPLNSKRNRGMTPLHLATMGGHRDVVQLLLDNGAEVNFSTEASETPLHQAVRHNHRELVELLIDRGAKTNYVGKIGTPLNLAIHENNLEMVKLLIDKGADVNLQLSARTRPPLYMAAKQGTIDIAELLLNSGADVNIYYAFLGDTPLHMAAEKGHLDMARLLIRYGADVNAVTRNLSADTPLHSAKIGGHREMMRLLKSHGGLDIGLSE
ncbi:ankyrin repeat domain-containing protein [Crocosphaera watsonii]|uniref:Ankyrin n=3 Tax=Crocosphaera watsonii TaxID=263511 RepID=T2JP90_CROWT|nr:ankyrin repeat domain-containing protein [Crocosphaera watsonii]EHJ09602.1 Ankyrin [Crocosphaera watsonii WH 0003]CCQ53750.1 Ankyrin [Crocosphaera watsonii WH 0005]CCQ66347.1 Ankyrin [Crocosphaera watsonii WH 0402]